MSLSVCCGGAFGKRFSMCSFATLQCLRMVCTVDPSSYEVHGHFCAVNGLYLVSLFMHLSAQSQFAIIIYRHECHSGMPSRDSNGLSFVIS